MRYSNFYYMIFFKNHIKFKFLIILYLKKNNAAKNNG